MMRGRRLATAGAAVIGFGMGVSTPVSTGAPAPAATALTPGSMASLGTIDERFQSYNIEMLELTGGNFWKPYGANTGGTPAAEGNTPPGMDPGLYEYRPPIDLSNPQLRILAAALGPAYVRSSGTWANAMYFPDSDSAPTSPPPGFSGVLSRPHWKGLIDFAGAVGAQIVTSFAISAGVRDANGVWTPEQARRLIDYTASVGGRIAAAEFMNEPTAAAMGSAPSGYDAASYGRDFDIFHDFARQDAPGMHIMGPGSVGEADGPQLLTDMPGILHTPDMLAAMNTDVDVFSYHHYGAASQRCASAGMPQTSVADALSEQWLASTDRTLAFYRRMRDQYEPGKPLWISETADAACGGNPWAATFLDTFRYLDQLGRMARQGVQVVMHNTLDASDYGLLDETTLTPRPTYWGALLWRKLMGTTVLDSGVAVQPGMHVYAHCLRGTPAGVAVMAINTDTVNPRTLSVPSPAERYTLQAGHLESRAVRLNGTVLGLDGDGQLPAIDGVQVAAGDLQLDPATITFLAVPNAHNNACP